MSQYARHHHSPAEPDRAGMEGRPLPAELALDALLALDQAVAVIGGAGEILLGNGAFQALVASPGGQGLLDCSASATEADRLHLADGRTVSVRRKSLRSGTLLVAEDVSARVAQENKVSREARTDPLTGLGNRVVFGQELSAALARPDPMSCAVLSVDLDRFKLVNDTLGHPIGDALLRAVADRIRSALPEGATAARLGGDEFGVLQTLGPQPRAAAELAARLVDLLGRAYLVEGHLINVGASVGVAPLSGGETAPAEVVKNSDLALYRAKRDGRGVFRFFEPAMDEQMQARRSLEIDLRRALALREFSLNFQPLFNIETRAVTGFEALLRWNATTRGAVSPAEFIPLAEEIGLIVPIGEWVIRTACRAAIAWPVPLTVAVNVSAVQFSSDGLVPTVLSALAESGLDPTRLELEITESVLLGDHGQTLEVLHRLRALGVKISMDDFGTGYSSLSYLRSFPFDKIKIDQCFIRQGHDDPSGAAIVGAIAALGRSLGMTTTAEGVETPEQFARIAADGCTDVQGYLISRPMPAGEVPDFLAAQEAETFSSP